MIAWHGADWKALHPLLDAGRLPHLCALVERGASGNLRSVGWSVPAAMWTSVATGKRPDQHGIRRTREADPLSGGARPASSRSRQAKAVWNISIQAGFKTHVVNWAASHPAESLSGSCITPSFVEPLAPFGSPWPVAPGSLYPPHSKKDLAELRIHAGDISARDLRRFVPSLDRIDQEADRRVVDFADTLAQTVSVHAICTWLLEHAAWDLMMIGWSGLERACHRFERYAAPQMDGISDADYSHYRQLIEEFYCFYDLLLGRIVELAGADSTIGLISTAGFRSGSERPVCALLQAKSQAWYRPYGVFCLAGPNIARDELLHNVNLLDVAPTMLALLGLPAGQDMPGRIVNEAFLRPTAGERIPSWEEVPGESGMHPRETEEEKFRSAAALDRLASLGYSCGDQTAALEARLEETWQSAYRRFCDDLAAEAAGGEGLGAAHERILLSHLESARGNRRGALAAMRAAERLGFDRPIVNWAAGWMYARQGDLSRAEEALREAVKLDSSSEQAYALLARVLILRGKCSYALEIARRGLSVDYASAALQSALGLALLGSGQDEEALQAFEAALAFDPNWREATEWIKAIRAKRTKAVAAAG